MSRVLRDRNSLITALGVGFLWGFLALVGLTLGSAAPIRSSPPNPTPVISFAVLAGGFLAGVANARRLSSPLIELGLVPAGGFGMGFAAVAAYLLSGSPVLATAAIACTGFAAGWFAQPLHALTNRESHHERRTMRAASLVATALFLALAWWVFYALANRANLTAAQIQGLAGSIALLVTAYVMTILPDFFVRFVLWMLTHTVYRIHVVGGQHVPSTGPALIIANHISMIDPALIGASTHRFVRFLMFGPHFRLPWLNWIVTRLHAIPVTAGKRRDVAEAIERSRAALEAGHVVCIFVEGAVSRTGNLLPFKRGFEKILAGLDVPVIPVYLDRVWGSVFSFKGGRFFWKLPERLPRPVTVTFGPPLPSAINALDSRLVLMELGAEAKTRNRSSDDLLHVRFMRRAKRRWWHLCAADSDGKSITYGRALIHAMRLSHAIREKTAGETSIGLVTRPSIEGALATIATLMAGRVPVHLDPAADADTLRLAAETAHVTTILTPRDLNRLHDEANARFSTFFSARFLPLSILRRRCAGDESVTSSATAAIVVTPGRASPPKAVVLTHANILANLDGLDQVFPTTSADRFLAVLPFSNALGLTGNIWFPLTQGCSVIYQQDPVDAARTGELAKKYCASVLIATPNQYASYLQRCTRDQFRHLRYAVAAIGKLSDSVRTSFEEQFGLPLFEGYGCAEMSPVVSVNRPNFGEGRVMQVGHKRDSVGHPLPGVAATVVDQDTWDGPIFGRPGLLLVKGPNLMAGYLDSPERTARTMHDGWYVTGDLASMDEDGFIFIDEANDAWLRRFAR